MRYFGFQWITRSARTKTTGCYGWDSYYPCINSSPNIFYCPAAEDAGSPYNVAPSYQALYNTYVYNDQVFRRYPGFEPGPQSGSDDETTDGSYPLYTHANDEHTILSDVRMHRRISQLIGDHILMGEGYDQHEGIQTLTDIYTAIAPGRWTMNNVNGVHLRHGGRNQSANYLFGDLHVETSSTLDKYGYADCVPGAIFRGNNVETNNPWWQKPIP